MPEEPKPAPEQPRQSASNSAAIHKSQPEAKYDYGLQMLIGVGAFLLLLAGLPALIILIVARPPAFLAWLVLPLILTALGVRVLARRAKGVRGFWPGFLLGLGVVGLAFGICATAFK